MEVKVDGHGTLNLSKGKSVANLVDELDYHRDSVIVLKDQEPVPLDKDIEEEEEYKIISVVSGG